VERICPTLRRPHYGIPENGCAERIRSLKALLAGTDYIAAKIAEGSATVEEYAVQIAQCQAWPREIAEPETAQ
jgi:hypothetical protein